MKYVVLSWVRKKEAYGVVSVLSAIKLSSRSIKVLNLVYDVGIKFNIDKR